MFDPFSSRLISPHCLYIPFGELSPESLSACSKVKGATVHQDTLLQFIVPYNTHCASVQIRISSDQSPNYPGQALPRLKGQYRLCCPRLRNTEHETALRERSHELYNSLFPILPWNFLTRQSLSEDETSAAQSSQLFERPCFDSAVDQIENYLSSSDNNINHDESSHEDSSHKESSYGETNHERSGHEEPSHVESNHERPSNEETNHERSGHEEPNHVESSHEESSHEESSHEESSHEESSHKESNHECSNLKQTGTKECGRGDAKDLPPTPPIDPLKSRGEFVSDLMEKLQLGFEDANPERPSLPTSHDKDPTSLALTLSQHFAQQSNNQKKYRRIFRHISVCFILIWLELATMSGKNKRTLMRDVNKKMKEIGLSGDADRLRHLRNETFFLNQIAASLRVHSLPRFHRIYDHLFDDSLYQKIRKFSRCSQDTKEEICSHIATYKRSQGSVAELRGELNVADAYILNTLRTGLPSVETNTIWKAIGFQSPQIAELERMNDEEPARRPPLCPPQIESASRAKGTKRQFEGESTKQPKTRRVEVDITKRTGNPEAVHPGYIGSSPSGAPLDGHTFNVRNPPSPEFLNQPPPQVTNSNKYSPESAQVPLEPINNVEITPFGTSQFGDLPISSGSYIPTRDIFSSTFNLEPCPIYPGDISIATRDIPSSAFTLEPCPIHPEDSSIPTSDILSSTFTLEPCPIHPEDSSIPTSDILSSTFTLEPCPIYPEDSSIPTSDILSSTFTLEPCPIHPEESNIPTYDIFSSIFTLEPRPIHPEDSSIPAHDTATNPHLLQIL